MDNGRLKLDSIWNALGKYERRVLMRHAERMLEGQSVYGRVPPPQKQKRNLLVEKLEELTDAVFYSELELQYLYELREGACETCGKRNEEDVSSPPSPEV